MVARGASTRGTCLEPWKEEVVGDEERVRGGEYTRLGTAVASEFKAQFFIQESVVVIQRESPPRFECNIFTTGNCSVHTRVDVEVTKSVTNTDPSLPPEYTWVNEGSTARDQTLSS
jgi:hypothetical protein